MSMIPEARRLLFIRTDRLGETLLNLPAVAALRAALPRASLTLLVNPDLQELLSGVPGVSQVIAYQPGSPRWWTSARRLGQSLRAGRFEIAIVSNPMKELHVAVWLAGIPCRVGYARKWGRWLLTHRLDDRKALGERHEVEYNLDLIRVLGLPTSKPEWRLPRFEREQAEALQLLQHQGLKPSEPFITVHPWTSNPLKQWPVERFRALLEHLSAQGSVIVVVIGGAQEQEHAKALLRPEIPRVVNLVGRLSLTQLAGLFQRARLLVSNDSGPVHLAAAVGTPVVALFGTEEPGSHPRRWGPLGTAHTILHTGLTELPVDEVFAAVKAYLT